MSVKPEEAHVVSAPVAMLRHAFSLLISRSTVFRSL
jgi:hypothetical protein